MGHAKRREFITHKVNEINNQVVRGLPGAFAAKLRDLKIGTCYFSVLVVLCPFSFVWQKLDIKRIKSICPPSCAAELC